MAYHLGEFFEKDDAEPGVVVKELLEVVLGQDEDKRLFDGRCRRGTGQAVDDAHLAHEPARRDIAYRFDRFFRVAFRDPDKALSYKAHVWFAGAFVEDDLSRIGLCGIEVLGKLVHVLTA